jgi:hypothetical protein
MIAPHIGHPPRVAPAPAHTGCATSAQAGRQGPDQRLVTVHPHSRLPHSLRGARQASHIACARPRTHPATPHDLHTCAQALDAARTCQRANTHRVRNERAGRAPGPRPATGYSPPALTPSTLTPRRPASITHSMRPASNATCDASRSAYMRASSRCGANVPTCQRANVTPPLHTQCAPRALRGARQASHGALARPQTHPATPLRTCARALDAPRTRQRPRAGT